MTNKNIKINASVSVCEENGRTKVHPNPSQFWLFYSNLSSDRQQCCCFMLSAQVSDLLKCSMESLDRIYFPVNCARFSWLSAPRATRVHLQELVLASAKQPKFLQVPLPCYLSTDSKGAEARRFSVDSDQINLILLC